MRPIDRITNAVAARLLPHVTRMIESANTRGRDALILEGTYDPSDHTALIAFARVAAAPAFEGNEHEIVRAVIAAPHIGDQTGPIGDEWGIALRTESGWIFHATHLPDDGDPSSIANAAREVPAGERWIGHRKPSTKQYDAELRFTNDGATSGDGLGGTTLGGGSLTKSFTAGGIAVTLDDAADTATIGKNGVVVVVDFVAGTVSIGGASLDATADAVVTHRYDQQNLDALRTSVQTALTTLASRCASGSGVAPPTIQPVTGAASSTVRAKG